MTSPEGAQNKEIDCLSPEAQRLVRGRHDSDLYLPAYAALVLLSVLRSRAAAPSATVVGVGLGHFENPHIGQLLPTIKWLAECKVSVGGALKSTIYAPMFLSRTKRRVGSPSAPGDGL